MACCRLRRSACIWLAVLLGLGRASRAPSRAAFARNHSTHLRAKKILASHDAQMGGNATRSVSYRQTLHNHQNVQYYADFVIGGQSIAGIFDTGSFELLVRSQRCEQCVHPTPPYDHRRSKTYEENGTVTRHVFGSGPCVSMLGYESVSVGPDLHAERQAFWEIVEHQIDVLNVAKFAAIVGIGPNWAYGNTEKTLLMSYGIDVFSICLQKPSGSPGYLHWGPEQGFDQVKHVSAKVIGKHHWVAHLHNVTFHATPSQGHLAQAPCANEGGCAAIIDSGTSLIAAPTAALAKLSAMIPPVMEDCSNLHELPPLRFVIDGHEFILPPQAYIMRVKGATIEADTIWDVLFFKPKIRKLDICIPAFMEMDMTSQFGPVWILGMPFFRYYHTTFDRTNEEMHFTRAGPQCEMQDYEPPPSGAASFLAEHSGDGPLDVDFDSIVPPTLSGMLDSDAIKRGSFTL